MSGRHRQPLSVLQGKGRKNLTKDEIKTRQEQEDAVRGFLALIADSNPLLPLQCGGQYPHA